MIVPGNYHVATSPMTGCIYAGTLKSPNQWRAQTEATDLAIAAVIEHMKHGEELGDGDEITIGFRIGDTKYTLALTLSDEQGDEKE